MLVFYIQYHICGVEAKTAYRHRGMVWYGGGAAHPTISLFVAKSLPKEPPRIIIENPSCKMFYC
jgi:hypothetical protein